MSTPGMFAQLWHQYSSAIITGAVIAFVITIIGVCVWLSQSSSDGPLVAHEPRAIAPLETQAVVKYNNGHANYSVDYPVGSVSYKSLKGDLIRFILPAGGPQQIFPNKTQHYTTTADITVTEQINGITQIYIMPAGSRVQLETSTDDLAVWCSWSSDEHQMWFNANLVQQQPVATVGDLITMILDGFTQL